MFFSHTIWFPVMIPRVLMNDDSTGSGELGIVVQELILQNPGGL